MVHFPEFGDTWEVGQRIFGVDDDGLEAKVVVSLIICQPFDEVFFPAGYLCSS